jgi:hypothetical protein
MQHCPAIANRSDWFTNSAPSHPNLALADQVWAALTCVLDSTDFYLFDSNEYHCGGGGALFVLRKRSTLCYFAAVVELQKLLNRIDGTERYATSFSDAPTILVPPSI